MADMINDCAVELVCLDADFAMFEQFGFVRAGRSRSRLATIVSTRGACIIVPKITLLGERGFCFYGYASNWVTPRIPGLIAADGERCVVVATHEDLRQPITIVRQDGRLPSYNAAIEYWSVLAAAKERMKG